MIHVVYLFKNMNEKVINILNPRPTNREILIENTIELLRLSRLMYVKEIKAFY